MYRKSHRTVGSLAHISEFCAASGGVSRAEVITFPAPNQKTDNVVYLFGESLRR
jgi:hypothetical protein